MSDEEYYRKLGKEVSAQLWLYDQLHGTRYNYAFDYDKDYEVLGEAIEMAQTTVKKPQEKEEHPKNEQTRQVRR